MKPFAPIILMGLLAISGSATSAQPQGERSEVVAPVWAGQPVGFAMIVAGPRLYIGYYGGDRQLVVASRAVSGGPWQRQTLDTAVGWDSHNAITMTTDSAGRLHVAANMHVSPMTYYMSDTSGAVSSLRRVPVLVDAAQEQRVTYPTFLKDKDGRLIFRYRDGMSGSGNDIYSVFDASTLRWRHMTATPVLDGEGKRNAYATGPTLGPDGWFHMVWLWRDSPAAETNHDLSYARSRDLVHWVRSSGDVQPLPIQLGNSEIVDPVPVHGGIINGNIPFGFDAQKRIMIAYHKFDQNGDTQVYLARREKNGWHIAQASRWIGYRWDFKGGGTLSGEMKIAEPYQRGPVIVLPIARQGKGMQLRLAADSLLPTNAPLPQTRAAPVAGWTTVNAPAGMKLNVLTAQGNGRRFRLTWPTLPNNRDQPRAKAPAATELRLSEQPQ